MLKSQLGTALHRAGAPHLQEGAAIQRGGCTSGKAEPAWCSVRFPQTHPPVPQTTHPNPPPRSAAR